MKNLRFAKGSYWGKVSIIPDLRRVARLTITVWARTWYKRFRERGALNNKWDQNLSKVVEIIDPDTMKVDSVLKKEERMKIGNRPGSHQAQLQGCLVTWPF